MEPPKTKKPDFIIVGTMKGGTAILYEFITLHPDIEPAIQKDIHYFSLHYHKGTEWYLNHFNRESYKITGEVSPTYFDIANSILIPSLIKTFNPNVKIILIVRDPIERALSHYNHLLKIEKKDEIISSEINDFFNVPLKECITETTNMGYYLKQILSFSSYYRKYLYYMQVCDKDNILVLRNDDLRHQPFETMKRVFGFIGVEPIESGKFRDFKYSIDTKTDMLSDKTYNRLAEILYPDYKKFCDLTDIEYSVPKLRNRLAPDHYGVHIGKNGWLFLVGGSNDPIEFYKKPELISNGLVSGWSNILGKRASYFKKKGIQYVHLFVPNKLTVFPEYYNGDLNCYRNSPLLNLLHRLNKHANQDVVDYILNPIHYYNKVKGDVKLYWKTDTHWTFFGAYSAYQLICSKLGLNFDPELLGYEKARIRMAMDLGGKLEPPVKEDVFFSSMNRKSKRVYANEIVLYKEKHGLENEMGLHVGSNVVFKNQSALNKKKVVLFGTSFSEYRPCLLTGILAETFSEVHFVWSTNLDWSYIKKIQPDIVLTEIVERFIPEVPSDNFNLKEYAGRKISKIGLPR